MHWRPYNPGAKGGSRRINNPAVKREIVRVTKSVCFDFEVPIISLKSFYDIGTQFRVINNHLRFGSISL